MYKLVMSKVIILYVDWDTHFLIPSACKEFGNKLCDFVGSCTLIINYWRCGYCLIIKFYQNVQFWGQKTHINVFIPIRIGDNDFDFLIISFTSFL